MPETLRHPVLRLQAVLTGGFVGSLARIALLRTVPEHRHGWSSVPWMLIGINTVGSLIAGYSLAWLSQRYETDHPVRLLVTTGFLGGLTSYSALVAGLFGPGSCGPVVAIATFVGSLGLGLLAAVGGYRWGAS